MTTIEKTPWQTTANRFVAFLDIMGFKDLVMRKSHKDIYDLLTAISKIRTNIETVGSSAPLRYADCDNYTASFSDSIIIFSKDDKPASFDAFTGAVVVLVSGAIKTGIPIKGALAYGNISVNKSSQIYFGQPIIDAHLMQEDVEYYGIVAHHSIVDYINQDKNLMEIRSAKYYFDCFTPLKSGLITHCNLNWFEQLLSEKDNELKVELYVKFNEMIRKFSGMMSGRPRKYLDNTQRVYSSCINMETPSSTPL